MMKLTELAEILLVVLYDLANTKGHGAYYSLGKLAAQFGEADQGKLMEVGNWMRQQGWADVLFSTAGADARILGAGSVFVESGGHTGAILRYRDGSHGEDSLLPYPGPSLTREEVVNHLLQCKAENWCQAVYKGTSPTEFVILTEGNRKIIVRGEPQGHVVIAEHLGSQTMAGRAENFGELVHLIAQAGNLYGGQWPQKVTSGRLSSSTPATNIATISALAGTATIMAVFDPYLSNQSLAALLDILTLGPSLSPTVRLLACKKMIMKPQLTKTFVDQWFRERGVSGGEVRLMPDGEHRRFILLSGGQSLILGMSLNGIAKNEAVRIEADTTDAPFFNSVWAAATTTPLT